MATKAQQIITEILEEASEDVSTLPEFDESIPPKKWTKMKVLDPWKHESYTLAYVLGPFGWLPNQHYMYFLPEMFCVPKDITNFRNLTDAKHRIENLYKQFPDTMEAKQESDLLNIIGKGDIDMFMKNFEGALSL